MNVCRRCKKECVIKFQRVHSECMNIIKKCVVCRDEFETKNEYQRTCGHACGALEAGRSRTKKVAR
jgi:hypothetical protein